jgi:solute carrier family 25 protein 16
MSTGHSDHAYDPHQTPESIPQSAPMSETAGSSLIRGATEPIASTHTDTMHKSKNADKKVDKRTLDYVVKSGIAGGLAGCAVS